MKFIYHLCGPVPGTFYTYYISSLRDFLWEILLWMVTIPIHFFPLLEISDCIFVTFNFPRALNLSHNLTFLALQIFFFLNFILSFCQVIQEDVSTVYNLFEDKEKKRKSKWLMKYHYSWNLKVIESGVPKKLEASEITQLVPYLLCKWVRTIFFLFLLN